MLREMQVGRRRLADYRSLVARDLLAEVRELATAVRGLRVCHVSAHGTRGGIAELLVGMVPLLNDVGVDASWRVLGGSDEYFRVGRALHDGLQGAPTAISDHDMRVYERHSLLNAGGMTGHFDVVIAHDPHPLGLRQGLDSDGDTTWIWRCHLDLSEPDPAAVERVRPLLDPFDLGVFHMPSYLAPNLVRDPVVIPPAIDPLTPKNMLLAADDAAHVVSRFGVDPTRPLMTQVSRFEPWKDPMGVIDAFRLAREEVPGLQLALVGPRRTAEASGEDHFQRTRDHAGGDPGIHLLSDEQDLGPVEVNAFQTQADVVVQKSLREGFGLTVTEALWKARPTVASDVGGIPRQITDAVTGYLVDSPERCAARVVDSIRDPAWAHEMALRGKQRVRDEFLTPRLLRDWLGLLRRVAMR